MSRVAGYGFQRPKAEILSRMADREATRQRKGPQTDYPMPLGNGGAPMVVQIWSDGATVGDLISPTNGYHSARLRFYGDGPYDANTIGQNVWFRYLDWESTDSGQVVGVHGKHYLAVPLGNITANGSHRPSFAACAGEMSFVGKADSNIAKGSSGTISLYHRSPLVDSAINLTGSTDGAALTSGKWCFVARPAHGLIYATPWEC